MPDLIDRIGAELVRAVSADPLPPEPADPRRARAARPRLVRGLRWRPLLIACGVMLGAAAAAIAANFAFAPGTAVGPIVRPVPTANDGVPIPGTAKLLAVAVADPRGGLRWGLRTVRTTRGETCIQVGRLDYGTVGVLGQDGAFADDGRFHPLSVDYLEPLSCGVDDAHGHAFLNVGLIGFPASGAVPGPPAISGCLDGWRPDRRRPCPQADTRDVYFGLLGPQARSVAYRDASGRIVSTPLSGADGAYLFVLPSRTSEQQGTTTVGPDLASSPITQSSTAATPASCRVPGRARPSASSRSAHG